MTDPEADGPTYLPFGAYALPSVLVAPRAPAQRTYELPSARQVVNAGLQLAFASTVAIRRASMYFGLLCLAAFGPAAILALVLGARLLSIPGALEDLILRPNHFLFEHPELAGPLAALYFVGIGAVVLLFALSIEAQAIAIAVLGGAAAEAPMTLREALGRARQTFWRLLGATLLVGLTSSVLSFVLGLPFMRPNDSNQGVSFITSMIGTLAVTPFAYASTGIVLGDAGPIETLKRSWRLFRARPRIALVVVLFTLVTAAIQFFAIDSGAGVTALVAEFFHIGADGGPPIVPAILVLALVVAFGSLTFTISAIVAAPQVAAFLGLTFYSAGLDRARVRPDRPSRPPRWVTIPMAIVMIGIGLVSLITLGSLSSVPR